MSDQQQMIALRDYSFTYAMGIKPALRHISLEIQEGDFIVLCGASGSGKSTLLEVLKPDITPCGASEGAIETALSPQEAAIVFQDPESQLLTASVLSDLALPMENCGLPPQIMRRRMAETVSFFGLEHLLHKGPELLSGGEKQLVSLCAALMMQPRLLLLDEPTAQLDPIAARAFFDMLRRVHEELGITVVLAEHRLAWITDLADRYFFFAAGRLAAQWSAAEFAALPADTLAGYGLRARTLDDCRAGIRAKQSARCPGTPVLTLEGVTLGCDKKHPLRTLPDMSFAAGEIVGLMGRNGIGKSTMARTLCGLLEPVSGKICRNGRPANARERLRSSFLVMQDVNYQLFSDSVREEVLLGAAHPERCDAVLQALGLDGLADRHPMSLSGGQKQRVVVAAAMLSDKPLILLDEPTSGLDLGSMQQVGQLLQEWKAQGKTLLVITHDEELAANWCDRVIRWDDTEGV